MRMVKKYQIETKQLDKIADPFVVAVVAEEDAAVGVAPGVGVGGDAGAEPAAARVARQAEAAAAQLAPFQTFQQGGAVVHLLLQTPQNAGEAAPSNPKSPLKWKRKRKPTPEEE